MTEAELRAMIDEGKPLSEIASEMAAGEYADFYFYDITMGTLDTPLAIEGIGDLVDHIAE